MILKLGHKNPELGFFAVIYSANFRTFVLTTFIPLSSEAFSSKTLCRQNSCPNNYLESAIIADVLPVPGGPCNNR